MSSQDLILSRSGSELSPLKLGLSAVLGPQYASGSSFTADVLSRLLFMIFERLLRSIEGLAKSYLEKFAEARSKLDETKSTVAEEARSVMGEVKSKTDEDKRPGIVEAINEHHATNGRSPFGPGGFTPPCAKKHGADFEPPWFVKIFLKRREKFLEWREAMTNA